MLSFLGLQVGPTFGETGASISGTPGQLPKTVVPRHYAIDLNPDLSNLVFEGYETIDIEVQEPTRTITLNALQLNVSKAVLTDLSLAAEVTLDSSQQTAILHFPKTIGIGAHRLKLDFRGTINPSAQGLFYTRYQTAGGQQKRMFCTQLEPTDARRLFPVWDEPIFRSSFELQVQVPESFTAISNMPVAHEQLLGHRFKRVQFARSPSMASYLVALCAGEFEALSEELDGVRIRVITSEGKKEYGRYAMETLKKLMPYYTEYFGHKYPLPKLDLIALPGGIRGAMENWGAITFNEANLLFDPTRSSQRTREYVFSAIAHEVAHQWFGNLVTLAWWDDLWLNEGFATWMQTKATAHFNPGWQVWPRDNRAKQDAMDVDARRTTHPIKQSVTDPAQAMSAFDAITYAKAAAIIRMLETYLGESTFRAGVRRYMADHQYANATTDDLWKALEDASRQPIRSVASIWIDKPGYPLIRAQLQCKDRKGTLHLGQERFTINDPSAQPQTWQVPLSYFSTSDDRSIHTYLLTGPEAVVNLTGCSRPVKLNAGNTGYYRVQYGPAGQKALFNNFMQLPGEDRLNLLSDTWALVGGNRLGAVDYLSLLERLGGENEVAVWEQVITTLKEIDRLQKGRPGRAAFQIYARSILRPPYDRLGWNAKPGESELEGLLRISVLSALGHFGDDIVIAEARRRFADFLIKETSLSPNLRATVLGIVGRYADQATYDHLHDLARKTDSIEQKQLLYGAMGAALDAKLATQTLALSLKDELESSLASSLVPKVSTEGEQSEMAWAFFQENHSALLAKVSMMGRYRYATYVANAFNDTRHANELLNFAEAKLPAEALPEIKKAVERIEFRDSLVQRELPKIDAWICGQIPGNERLKTHCASQRYP